MIDASILDPEFMSSLSSIMSCMSDMSSTASNYGGASNPISLNIDGLYSGKGIEFLFSEITDGFINKIMDAFNMGNYSKVIDMCKQFADMLDRMGVGHGMFQGEISNRVISVVKQSVDSAKFNRTKGKLKKALLIVKNLKKQARYIQNSEVRIKYMNAVAALKTMVKVINNVYENRKRVNGEVVKGLKSLVFEETNEPIKLIKLEL